MKLCSDVWWWKWAGTWSDFLVKGMKLLQLNASVSTVGTCWSESRSSISLKDLEMQIMLPLPLWFPLLGCHLNHLSSIEWVLRVRCHHLDLHPDSLTIIYLKMWGHLRLKLDKGSPLTLCSQWWWPWLFDPSASTFCRLRLQICSTTTSLYIVSDYTQGLLQARQAFYQLNYIPVSNKAGTHISHFRFIL